MIEFLRMRQEIKRIEHDRMIKMKDKQEKRHKANRQLAGSDGNSTSNKAGEAITIVSKASHISAKKISQQSNEGAANIIYEED